MIGEKVILGNLNNNKLLDIWFSKKSVKIRQMLNNSNRNFFKPCNVCDVEGTLMGEKNAGYFKLMIRKVLILGGSSDIGKEDS